MLCLALSAATFGCGASAPLQEFTTTDESQIRSSFAEMTQAVRDTNWTRWAEFYAADGTLFSPNQPPFQGHDAILQFARAFPPLSTFEITPARIEGREDLAVAYGKYHWVIAPPGASMVPDSGKFILVLRKQPDGQWKIVYDMSNSEMPLHP
jgi:uncharacterized protein (TIGR02246 family)